MGKAAPAFPPALRASSRRIAAALHALGRKVRAALGAAAADPAAAPAAHIASAPASCSPKNADKTEIDAVIGRLMQAFDTNSEALLAAKLGKSRHTLRVWRSRGAVPLASMVDAARLSGFSLEWLRGDPGAGPLHGQRPQAHGPQYVALTERERQFIDNFRASDEAGRAAIEAVTGALAVPAKEAA